MKIYGLEKLSLVDYDGCVAATVFTGACNFRCPFCHNGALVTDFSTLPEYPMDEFFSYITKRKGILDGVCITGGEPTLHKDLPDFIEKIKKIGYKVKLDTNGTNPEMVKSLSENGLVDYFAMDIKSDKAGYGKAIGIDGFPLKNVEKTVDFFLSGATEYEFRTTLISEYHGKTVIENIGKWIKGAKAYFMQKFKKGDNCLDAGDLSEVPEKTAKEFLSIITPFVQKASLRGY